MTRHNFPKYPDDIRDLLTRATVTYDGKEIEDLDDVFTCISQDLDDNLPRTGYTLEYNRARAQRLWQEHRDTLNEIWAGLHGGPIPVTTSIKINVFRDAGRWYGARWIDGQYDGCDSLGIPDDASELEALEAAATTKLSVHGHREICRVEDVNGG